MTSTDNAELRAFQVSVRDKIRELGRTLGWRGGPDVERQLGLDQLVDNQTVTVHVTVPAGSPEEARAQVATQVQNVYLPSGWSADVR